MDSNAFFRFLGRLNTVLLSLLALAILYFMGSEWLRPLRFNAAHTAAVPQTDADSGFTYEFGSFENVSDTGASGTLTVLSGTKEALMEFRRVGGTRYEGLSSSGPGREEENVNILIVDTDTAATRWMFRGTNRAIVSGFFVHENPAETGGGPVTALLLSVADKDTDGNGVINSADNESLYLYRPGAASASRLLEASAISDIIQLDAGRLLITYFDGKSDRVAVYTTRDFKPAAQGTISATPAK